MRSRTRPAACSPFRSRDGGAVAPGDYGALAETSFSFSTFAEVDLDTNPDDTVTDLRWQASREFTIRTTNELDVEPTEAFTVELSVDSTSANHDKLVPAGSPATVTIRSSDFPEVSVRAPSGTFVEASNVRLHRQSPPGHADGPDRPPGRDRGW